MGCCCKGFPPFSETTCYFDGSAQRVATFDAVEIAANPNNFGIANITNMINGNYSGLAACTLNVPGGAPGADSGIVFDFVYDLPWDRVMNVRITTNFGNFLNDGDAIFDPTAQLFDENNVALTAPFVAAANNGGAFFTTPVPGAPIDGVKRLRLSNIRGCCNVTTVGIREVELLVQGIGPAALVYCPENASPVSWVDPRNGNAIPFSDLTTCR